MAGLGGLPYFIQYQGELQNQALQRQQAQQQLLAFQQAQQDRQRQQAAQAAAGNALPQLFAGGQPAQLQAPPPPQPPAPGQGSQPAQQASGGVPLPQGPVPGQVLRPPLPPGGVQGQVPHQPFRRMPTSPPPVQSQAPAIPSPPQAAPAPQQQGPLTLDSAVKVLRDQGLEGADLFAGLQQLTPLLDAQSKQQAAALQQRFNQELQLARLNETADYHGALAQSRDVSEEERARHNQALEGIQQTLIPLKAQALQQKIAGNPDAKLAPDDVQFMAEQYLAAPDPSIFTNLGRGAQGAQNVVALRKAIKAEAQKQGLSPADVAALGIGVQGEKAAARTAGTRAANVGLAAAEAQQTFPLVRQASAALPRTQFVPANRAIQAAETNTGDPRVIALGTALNTSVNAYARAISPTGTPTVADKEHARELLSTANTPEQLDAALNIMEQEMQAAQRAPQEVKAQQRERIAGKPAAQAQETKTIGGKTYVKRGNDWFEQ